MKLAIFERAHIKQKPHHTTHKLEIFFSERKGINSSKFSHSECYLFFAIDSFVCSIDRSIDRFDCSFFAINFVPRARYYRKLRCVVLIIPCAKYHPHNSLIFVRSVFFLRCFVCCYCRLYVDFFCCCEPFLQSV